MSESNAAFIKAAKLTKRVQWSLYLLIFLTLCTLVFEYRDYQIVSALGSDYTEEAALAATGLVPAFVDLAFFIVNLVSGVLILMWIYRANANAKLLGAADMQFSPGWSVGWYFIPIMWLWKPYQVMKEIWQTSANPQDWKNQSVTPLIGWWWFFWIATCWLGNLAFKSIFDHKDELHHALSQDVIFMISDMFTIPLCLVFLEIVKKINQMQNTQSALTTEPLLLNR